MLMNNFTLAISGPDSLKPLGIQFGPFANGVPYMPLKTPHDILTTVIMSQISRC